MHPFCRGFPIGILMLRLMCKKFQIYHFRFLFPSQIFRFRFQPPLQQYSNILLQNPGTLSYFCVTERAKYFCLCECISIVTNASTIALLIFTLTPCGDISNTSSHSSFHWLGFLSFLIMHTCMYGCMSI